MSVITSKSTMLSILKVPSATPRLSMHRVRFQLPNDIRKILLDFKMGNTKDYENLVCTIRDSEINDSDLLSLINEAKNCTSLLNYDLRLFVQALILVKWTHRDENVVKAYQEFINDLVSAHSCHIQLVVNQLVSLFLNSEGSEWLNSVPCEFLNKQFNNIHLILQSTLITVPMSEEIVIRSVRHHFPFINTATHKQMSYLYNSLRIIQYWPDLRINLLKVLIDKLMFIDVQSPRNEIIQYEESSDNLLCNMEVCNEIDKSSSVSMKHPFADALDAMMDMMFQFIKNECYTDEKFNQSRCHKLYNDLMVAFEIVILPTHACNHVQFILFYICSFDITLAHEFLKFLWRQVTSPSVLPNIRQTAVAYLSSFLARADYLGLGPVKNYLTKLCDWIHNYIARHDSVPTYQSISKKHNVFYSICEAMFHVIVFRHQDLVYSANKLVFLQSLNLPKIVSCKLNPLKYCLPAVVENFAAVTRAYQLAYCYTIIENNARAKMPVLGYSGMVNINTLLDSYFPFEPCVLFRTKNYINPLYREYRPVLDQETTKINTKKERLYSGTEDEDDFIGDEGLEDEISSTN